MNPIERAVRRVDRVQQRSGPLAFTFSVFKKFGDDRGATLASQLAYYGFLSLLPALLVATTVIGYIGNDRAADSLIATVLGELPVFGEQIGPDAVRPIEGNWFGLAVGVVGLVYGALGVAQAGQHAMAQVWNVPGVDRPGFVPRLARSVGFVLLLGAGALGIAAVGGLGPTAIGVLLQVLATAALYVASFRILTPRAVPLADLVPGAVVAAIGYSLLLQAGTSLVRNQLDRSEDLYGQFALVLGLLGWLNLVSVISLYGAELNVVVVRKLWPRSIVQPPLTRADEQVLSDIALQEERRPEQRVDVDFESEPVSPPAGGAPPRRGG
jgi:YihY family inner membrane protein